MAYLLSFVAFVRALFVSLSRRFTKKARRKAVWSPEMRAAAANRMRARMVAFHAAKRNGNGSTAQAN